MRLAPDLLDVDNHRWLSLPVKEQLRVLCVDGKPSARGRSAARPTTWPWRCRRARRRRGRGEVQVEVASERELLERDLDAYDCIFLANVQQFTRNEAQVLSSYLRRGGGLVFFLGDQVRPDSYNEYLFAAARLAHAGAAGAAGHDRGGEPVSLRAGRLPASHHRRFSRPGAGRPADDAGLQIHQARRCRQDSQAKVALAFENGDPVIVEEQIEPRPFDSRGHQRRCLLDHHADVAQLCAGRAGTAGRGRRAEAGRSATRPSGRRWAARFRTLATRRAGRRSAAGRRSPPGEAGRRRGLCLLDATARRIKAACTWRSSARRCLRNESFAVNVDTAESDLTKLDLAELRSDEVWPGISFEYNTSWQNLDERPSGEISRRATFHPLYGCWDYGVLLAWCFGRETAVGLADSGRAQRHELKGTLPTWVERLLGVDTAESGEGTVWGLDHSWSWAPWVTVLFVAGHRGA